MKEFHHIRCCEAGIEYKKLMRSYGEFTYGRSKLFIHKAHPAKWPYVISDINSGLAISPGLKKPTERAAKLHLAKTLTDEQDQALELLPSQRLRSAYHRRRLSDLPHRREVAKDILYALEEQMTSGNPF